MQLMQALSNNPNSPVGGNGLEPVDGIPGRVPNRYLNPPQGQGMPGHGRVVYGHGLNGHPFYNEQAWLHSLAHLMQTQGAPQPIGPEPGGRHGTIVSGRLPVPPGMNIGGKLGLGNGLGMRPPFAGGVMQPGGGSGKLPVSGPVRYQPLHAALLMRALGR